MKMPYNKWFYDQYKYLTGITNGLTESTDTKWETINNRLKTLKDIDSPLLDEQPFGVIGNNRGFDHLLDLMGISNYTFEDINDSLIDTYKYSLKNAMGRMMVNTQAVMFKTEQMDFTNVVNEEFSHYYIVEAPFNQLHFGGRDQFIRQQIIKMYEQGTKSWMSVQDFIKTFNGQIKNGPAELLPFTMIATINGFMCNDFFVAISDQGMKFKIGWPYSADAKFILYKLDIAGIYTCETNMNNIQGCLIPYEDFDLRQGKPDIGTNCLINIYDKNFIKTSPSVPNFGWFNENGLSISKIQKRTYTELERKQSEKITVVVYVLKYFQEVQGLFPAINYLHLMDKRRVYDYEGNSVTDVYKNQIYASSDERYEFSKHTTPPICIDRKDNKAFRVLSTALQLKSKMMELKPIFKDIGQQFQSELNKTSFVDKILEPILSYKQPDGLLKQLMDCFNTYQQIAIITSLIPMELIEKFKDLIKLITELSELTEDQFEESYVYNIDVFNGQGWDWFVNDITNPIINSPLKPFENINELVSDYFHQSATNHKRFNRPVSEQCLICLRWDPIEDAWLFHLPEIERFKGIGNTFYIDKDLKGDEIFKFFVLYTDTENPRDTHVETLKQNQIFDFDKFMEQLDSHIGYIRYWNAENRLLKMSHVLYNKYDDTTITNTLSKILKNIIDGNDILDVDMSNINYEASGIITMNVNDYDAFTEEAPFVLNYIFYTLAHIQENEDKLQSYFYHQLVMKKFNKRYFDMFIDTTGEMTYPINYSKFNQINYNSMAISGFLMGEDNNETLRMYEDNAIGEIDPESKFIVKKYGEGEDDIEPVMVVSNENDPNVLSLGTFTDEVKVLTPEQKDEYWSNANFMMTTLDRDQYDQFIGDNSLHYYYGIPSIYKSKYIHTKGHPYVFNVFKADQKHYMITKNDLNQNRYKTLEENDWTTISYKNDIELVRRLTFYLTYIYNGFADIQTNFTTSFNNPSMIDTHIETIENEISLLTPFKDKKYQNSNVIDLIKAIIYDNIFITKLKNIKKLMRDILVIKARTQNRNFYQFINQIITDIQVIHKNYGFDDIISKRIMNLYQHLMLINTQNMTCYQFREWLNNVDTDLLGKIDTLYAQNENHNIIDSLFEDQNEIFISYRDRAIPLLDKLNDVIINVHMDHKGILLGSHIEQVYMTCLDLMRKSIFDLYVLRDLPSLTDVTFGSEPYIVQAIITSKNHINMSNGTNNESTKLLFQPILDKIDGGHYIRGLSKICEYTFFNGEDVDVEIRVLTIEGKELLQNSTASIFIKKQTLTFQKIGSTADDVKDFEMLVGIYQMISNFKNIHQATLNYELLHGNNLIQLNHSTQHEYAKTEDGPFDRVEVSNQLMNDLMNDEYSKRLHHQVFFKPVQIMIPHDNIKSVGSKYFIGQTLWLRSKDNKCLFPITVTSIDHSINSGFIEAEVSPRSKWFEMTSGKDIKRYFRGFIDCEILDDNISNFLDEFSNSDYWTYSNTNWNKMIRDYDKGSLIKDTVIVLGDPLYVQNNTPFIYSRLSWIFNELIPNHFIDDQHKQRRFLYAGKFDSHDLDNITIKMIDHNFDQLTLQEKYPILREEPNDHSIWADEILKFTEIKDQAIVEANKVLNVINETISILNTNLQDEVRFDLEKVLERDRINYQSQIELKNRMQSYIDHLEPPTDWHNVRSYDTALVYIQNGRAFQSHSFIPSIRDIPYNKKLDVFIFDWENKMWLDPHTYGVDIKWENNIQIHKRVEYQSRNVLHQIIIKPKTGFKDSKSLLVYFSYEKSDVFNGVEKDYTNECKVRFKPILSLPNRDEVFEPYKDFAIRKHVSGIETYIFGEEDI